MWGLNCALRGTSALEEPTRRGSTSVAPSNFSFSAWPTWRKGGTARQHVFTSQEPDTPWHLHSTRMCVRIACRGQGGERGHQEMTEAVGEGLNGGMDGGMPQNWEKT